MDLQLKGKTALVSGSTAGIGFAIAQSLAAEGARVIVNGRTAQRVNTARQQIDDKIPGAKTLGAAADLATAAGVQAVTDRFKAVDILVNNLGIFDPKAFTAIEDVEWFTFFETNVMSGVRLSRLYLPVMKEKGCSRIVFISSESGLQIPSEMIHYGVTKTAQIALARGLAETTRGTAVTVNSILPGPTRSEGVGTFVADLAKEQSMTEDAFEEAFFDRMRPSSLIQRFADTQEVANLVVYTCSPLASATNGTALRVDGGVARDHWEGLKGVAPGAMPALACARGAMHAVGGWPLGSPVKPENDDEMVTVFVIVVVVLNVSGFANVWFTRWPMTMGD